MTDNDAARPAGMVRATAAAAGAASAVPVTAPASRAVGSRVTAATRRASPLRALIVTGPTSQRQRQNSGQSRRGRTRLYGDALVMRSRCGADTGLVDNWPDEHRQAGGPEKGLAMKKRVILYCAMAVFVLTAALSGAGMASAQTESLCGNGGSGYCMNDWNDGGSANPVKMYYGGYSNDAFFLEAVDLCSSGPYVTSDCPFTNTTLDKNLEGEWIAQIVYSNNGLCVGTNSSGDGALAKCNNTTTGTGGGNGTIVVLAVQGSCNASNEGILINRYYTNINGEYEEMASGGSVGSALNLEAGNSGTCWGGSGWTL